MSDFKTKMHRFRFFVAPPPPQIPLGRWLTYSAPRASSWILGGSTWRGKGRGKRMEKGRREGSGEGDG